MTNDGSSIDASPDYALLALAGLVQSAALVHAIANGRSMDPAAGRTTLAAVMTHHAGSLAEVFGSSGDLRLGMQTLKSGLSGEAITPEVVRYALQLQSLAARLRRSKRMSARLGQMLDTLPSAASGAEPAESELAQAYQQTIGGLGKRIQVTGEIALLQQESVADSIRAQLLAGVRFAWLWRQLGGRRWHLILRRRSLLVALQSLMSRD